jgi:hypothetical protein
MTGMMARVLIVIVFTLTALLGGYLAKVRLGAKQERAQHAKQLDAIANVGAKVKKANDSRVALDEKQLDAQLRAQGWMNATTPKGLFNAAILPVPMPTAAPEPDPEVLAEHVTAEAHAVVLAPAVTPKPKKRYRQRPTTPATAPQATLEPLSIPEPAPVLVQTIPARWLAHNLHDILTWKERAFEAKQ